MADKNATEVLGKVDSITKDPKATKDYSKEAQELITKAQALAESGRVLEAVEEVLVLEKKARQASDGFSVSMLACHILKTLKNAGKWDSLNEYVVLLCKKRGQLKRAIVDMVQLCMSFVTKNEEASREQVVQLIQTLSSVTEGKIFVEVERARLIKILSQIKEDEGNIEEAANVLQEVQVDTFGAMEMREKAEYILFQMRMLLLKKDYVRCQIVSKKINTKLLESDDMQDIKLKFYNYMIQYYLHENQLQDVCKCYFYIFHTKCVLKDVQQWTEALQCYILYLILSPQENGKTDMIHRLQVVEKKKLDEMPLFKRLLMEFFKEEVMVWPLPYEDQIKNHSVFMDGNTINEERWNTLRKRVLRHNIKVIGTYYSRITMNRLASILGITVNEAEAEISELVYAKALHAKIDRPAGIVNFTLRKETTDMLNDWSGDIKQLLDLVEESSHLIQKEKMVNAARNKKLHLDAKACA